MQRAPSGQPSQAQRAALLADYFPPDGASDLLLDAHGMVRDGWDGLLDGLSALSADDFAKRIDLGRRYLRDAGVFFRLYDGETSSTREWPLAPLPVVVSSSEWQGIVEGLTQRAELLEAVTADLYGPQQLVADGHLPAALIARSPEFLRPMVGVRPRSGHFLHFVAFDLGRGPTGRWWVLGDRTQAPSGAGFALENRIATARVFPELIAEAGVHRLASFFDTFRETLDGLSGPQGRVGILSPGQFNDSYFEHAYIARYLGYTLLEGEDLTVVNGQVMVRTVDGLSPVSVLWRRLDALFADPLELDENSRLGTPGLLSAIRQGGVEMVNALGTGILETRAFLAFLPRLSEAVLGVPLTMPNIATWWCGQPSERAYVRDNLQTMMIGSALATRLPFETEEATVHGASFQSRARETIDAWLETEGSHLVGQEAVTLATTPVYADGRLMPRPVSLRVFAARTPHGWRIMPGGYARIGNSEDPRAISLQRGGSVADIWVLGTGPATGRTTPPLAAPYVRPPNGVLPSRAADNLFWMGRYVERAEGVARMLRAYHIRRAETLASDTPLLKALAEELALSDADPGDTGLTGLRRTLDGAERCAGQVRDRFSTDGWLALSELAKTVTQEAEALATSDDLTHAMGAILRRINAFSGLVHDNMYRFSGWRFLRAGRALERSITTSRHLARLADRRAPDGALDLVVELADSVMTHRRRFTVSTSRETVVDLLALDGRNPRSVVYQLTELRELLEKLPGARVNGQLSPLMRAAIRTQTALLVATPETLGTSAMQTLARDGVRLSELLTAAYMR